MDEENHAMQIPSFVFFCFFFTTIHYLHLQQHLSSFRFCFFFGYSNLESSFFCFYNSMLKNCCRRAEKEYGGHEFLRTCRKFAAVSLAIKFTHI